MKVQVCTGKSCSGKFSKYIIKRLESDAKFYKWKDVKLEECLCMWDCKRSPNIKIESEKYNYVWPAKVSELILQKISSKKIEISKKTHKKK